MALARGVKGAVVVLVPGAAVWAGGVASPSLRRRVEAGASIIRDGGGDWLLLSGGVGRYPPSEAQVAAEIAELAGVAPTAILLEERSKNSIENIRFSLDLLENHGTQLAQLRIVSDWFHLPRLWLIACAFGTCPKLKRVRRGGLLAYLTFGQLRGAVREVLAMPVTVLRLARLGYSGQLRK